MNNLTSVFQKAQAVASSAMHGDPIVFEDAEEVSGTLAELVARLDNDHSTIESNNQLIDDLFKQLLILVQAPDVSFDVKEALTIAHRTWLGVDPLPDYHAVQGM